MRYLLIVLVSSFLLPARINLMPSDDFYGLETSEGTINHTIKEFILSGQSVDDLPSFIMKYGDIKLESDRSFIWGNQTYYVGNNTLNEKRRRFNENDRVVVYALFNVVYQISEFSDREFIVSQSQFKKFPSDSKKQGDKELLCIEKTDQANDPDNYDYLRIKKGVLQNIPGMSPPKKPNVWLGVALPIAVTLFTGIQERVVYNQYNEVKSTRGATHFKNLNNRWRICFAFSIGFSSWSAYKYYNKHKQYSRYGDE